MNKYKSPRAFLCHASEDKSAVHRLASELMAKGIDTFFDAWEIRAGDSLRQRIDQGIADCTHFIVVISPISLTKPWVNAELDAGFVARLSEEVRLIPLRLNLDVSSLPPLLKGMYSPSLDDFDSCIVELINDIHGITRRPPLGQVPATALPELPQAFRLSPLASRIARALVESSVRGRHSDPQMPPDALRSLAGAPDEDIVEALSELEDRGWLYIANGIGGGALSFAYVGPRPQMFVALDSTLKSWDPAADARALAAEIVATAGGGAMMSVLDQKLGWGPRRMNPAITYLVDAGVMDHGNEISLEYQHAFLRKNVRTRQFLRS